MSIWSLKSVVGCLNATKWAFILTWEIFTMTMLAVERVFLILLHLNKITIKNCCRQNSGMYSEDYDSYVSEYLTAIESLNDDKFKRRGLPMQYVRETIVSEDVHGLLELQQRDWSYFIRKLFELSQKENLEFKHLGTEANT